MHQANVPDCFPNDISTVEKFLRNVQYKFESGIVLIGERDDVESRVDFSRVDEDTTRLTFQDRIYSVQIKP